MKVTSKYVVDHETGNRTIITCTPFCKFCFKEFKNGSYGEHGLYFAAREKFLVCRDCLMSEGKVNIYHDQRNTAYLFGDLRVVSVESFKEEEFKEV